MYMRGLIKAHSQVLNTSNEQPQQRPFHDSHYEREV